MNEIGIAFWLGMLATWLIWTLVEREREKLRRELRALFAARSAAHRSGPWPVKGEDHDES